MGRFRGTWHLGYSYSKGDIVKYSDAFYVALSHVPCIDKVPSESIYWQLKPKKDGEKNGENNQQY